MGTNIDEFILEPVAIEKCANNAVAPPLFQSSKRVAVYETVALFMSSTIVAFCGISALYF